MTCRGRVRPPRNNYLLLPDKFQQNHFNDANHNQRHRKFSPQNLFLTLAELVSGTNNEGYSISIINALSEQFIARELPSKSALCQYRQEISFEFFRDFFLDINDRSNSMRKTWRGLYVYAVDGLQLTLPRSDDIMQAGYSGRKVSKYRESYMPKMFSTMAYDVLNGTVKDIRENSTLNEIADAAEMIEKFEDNSLTIYDRLYCCRKLILKHSDQQNYFLFRLKTTMFKEMRSIITSKQKRKKVVIDGVEMVVIKIFNFKTQEWGYFCTNLPMNLVTEKNITKLYGLRWEVETSFRDFTQTIQLEQWHSKFINGIRQELYVALVLYNFVKLKILSKFDTARECLRAVYYRPNFKLLFNWISSRLFKIFYGVRDVMKDFEEHLVRSLEKRKRRSRSYKREIKSPQSTYPYNNTVWYGLN